MAYHLAPSLVTLRNEINAVWPNRSKASDGWIGDTSHSARKSDHNPDYSSGGVVRAIDVTNAGIDVDTLIQCAINDWRTAYVISRGLIYTRDNGFRPVRYTGSNPHNQHVHISTRHGATYDNSTASWELASRAGQGGSGGGSAVQPNPTPTPAGPINTIGKNMLLNADTYRARGVLGVLCLNGAFAEITNKGEFDNLRKAGVPYADVTDSALNALIKDGRGQYATVAVRNK